MQRLEQQRVGISRAGLLHFQWRGDQQNDFALGRMRLEPGDQPVRQTSAQFLVQLGQLARDRDFAIRKDLADRRERFCQPRRGLVEDQRGIYDGQLGQHVAPRLLLARQETGEQEAIVGQARDAQPGDRGAGAGQHGDCDPLGAAIIDQPVAGIGYQRRPRIAHQRHRAASQGFHQPLPVAMLAVVVVAPQRLRDAQMLHQLARHPGVLAGHTVAAPQHIGGAQGDVPEIANRGRDDIEPGFERFGHTGCGFAHGGPMNQQRGTRQG